MLLADLGADVIRIDRPGDSGLKNPIVDRGRAAMTIDIRTTEGRAKSLEACDLADVLVEGMRPGVMERLGLGPDVLLERNPRLVYARMTGWGQDGPRAHTAGHDINYIALTGALAAIGMPGERSLPPLNLVGDFGGGSMLLAFGIMAALYERERSGKGQVVDAAIVDGVSSLMTMFAGWLPSGRISLDRERNPLGGAAPFYRTYLCADGREVAVGALEPQFWTELLNRLGIDPNEPGISQGEDDWPATRARLERAFAERTSQEWIDLFEGSDACVTPVLSLTEAATDSHLSARDTYIVQDGLKQVSPSPRFSRTPGTILSARSGATVLNEWAGQSHDHE
jgi:alpha-methylacyl-CoA racemase